MRSSEPPDRAWSSARGKPPPAVYELGTASEDSNRRAVIPGWRANFLGRSGAEGDRRARFDFPGHDDLSNHRPSGRPLRPFLLASAATRWRLPGRSSLLLSGGINDGVAES